MAQSFKVTLKRGLMGCTQRQRDTLRCLGLNRRSQVVSLKDNPSVRGQIMKVQHLVEISVEKV